MNLHDLLLKHPRHLDIARRRDELAQQRAAHSERTRRAEEAYEKAMKQYRAALSRAIGDEELSELTEPQRPAILDPMTSRAVVEEHHARSEALDREEQAFRSQLAADLAGDILDRKRQLRDGARALVTPILGDLRGFVAELESLRETERVLEIARLREHAGPKVAAKLPPHTETVTLTLVIAEIIGDDERPRRRLRDLVTPRGREQTRMLKESLSEERAAEA